MFDSAFEPVSARLVTLTHRLSKTNQYTRDAAAISAEHASEEILLSLLWEQLALGTLEIVDDFLTANGCYLITQPREAPQLKRSEQRGVAVLKQVLLAGCQKVVAYELELAPSTVAQLSRSGLSFMGLRCRVQSAPYMLVAAAHASGENADTRVRRSSLHYADTSLQVFRISRPDVGMSELLTPAVLEVTRSLIEGKDRAVIAGDRRTSTRTIANQLGSAFKQLHATSRLDLLRVLARTNPLLSGARSFLTGRGNWPDRAENACTSA